MYFIYEISRYIAEFYRNFVSTLVLVPEHYGILGWTAVRHDEIGAQIADDGLKTMGQNEDKWGKMSAPEP
jgi:hypothetical protein